jgi:hypothetical protein
MIHYIEDRYMLGLRGAAIESRDTLKTYFETGDVPTQDQFMSVTSSKHTKTGHVTLMK